jgi:hypothetical protein
MKRHLSDPLPTLKKLKASPLSPPSPSPIHSHLHQPPTFHHHGPWSLHSRSHPTLSFLELYQEAIDSLCLPSIPYTRFFSPFSTYHDTKGCVHFTGPQIWGWLARQLVPFESVRHEVVEIRVVSEYEEGKGRRDIVYGETLAHFRLRGESEEIVCPRFFVWTVVEVEEVGEGNAIREARIGTEGLVIENVRVFWDTGVIGRFVTERKRRREEETLVERERRKEAERERLVMERKRADRERLVVERQRGDRPKMISFEKHISERGSWREGLGLVTHVKSDGVMVEG